MPTATQDPTVLTPEQWQQLDNIRQAERARRSFRLFIPHVYSILEPQTIYKENIVTAAICEHLEAVSKGQIKRLLISCPPQFGKSHVASVAWCMWDWIDNPHRKFLNVSFKMTLATDLAIKSNRIFHSDWFQNSYAIPRKIELVKDTEDFLENTLGGSRRATAFESATGFGVAGGVLVVDDPHQATVSDEERLKQIEAFNRGLSNRPGAMGSLVVIGQRVHTNDLIGTLEQLGGYEHLCLPNEYDPRRSKVTSIGWHDPRTTENELLWPEVFTEARTKEAKKYGRTHYEGQYNQAPVRKGGNIFSKEDFQYYTEASFPSPDQLDQTIISLDCSFSDTKTSDFVVVQCWSSSGSRFYLRDQDRQQADFAKTVQMFQAMCKKWPNARARYVEQGANGFAIISALKNRMSGIIAVKVGNASKVSRYQAVAPLVQAHNVYLPHADWVEEFLLEAESVPSSRHDDQMDCMSQALHQLETCVPFTDVFGGQNDPIHKFFL
jgi:predicted phage terminase large subunit-like protein